MWVLSIESFLLLSIESFLHEAVCLLCTFRLIPESCDSCPMICNWSFYLISLIILIIPIKRIIQIIPFNQRRAGKYLHACCMISMPLSNLVDFVFPHPLVTVQPFVPLSSTNFFFAHKNILFANNRFSIVFFSTKMTESEKFVLVSCIIDFDDYRFLTILTKFDNDDLTWISMPAKLWWSSSKFGPSSLVNLVSPHPLVTVQPSSPLSESFLHLCPRPSCAAPSRIDDPISLHSATSTRGLLHGSSLLGQPSLRLPPFLATPCLLAHSVWVSLCLFSPALSLNGPPPGPPI